MLPFRHSVHVGWDVGHGVTVKRQDGGVDMDDTIPALLRSAGEDVSNLNADELNTVYQFVDTYGGVAAVRQQLERERKESRAGPPAPPPPPAAPHQPPPPPVRQGERLPYPPFYTTVVCVNIREIQNSQTAVCSTLEFGG